LVVDHVTEMKIRHNTCGIPARIAALEKTYARVETIAWFILCLVSLGRLWDGRELITWLLTQI